MAGKLKAEGVKAGVPDLFLPVPRGIYHGAAIEMKTLKGRPTEHQRRWLKDLSEQGYYAIVCKGRDAAVEELTKYLEL